MFTSWGRETIHTYTKDQISNILKELETDESYGNVLRAKGMVAGADGEWIYFDMVPEEHEVRTGAPEYTGRICVIGAELNEDKLGKHYSDWHRRRTKMYEPEVMVYLMTGFLGQWKDTVPYFYTGAGLFPD